MNPLDAREAEETYEYPARPYTLPTRPVQRFRVLSESGDVPTRRTPTPKPDGDGWVRFGTNVETPGPLEFSEGNPETFLPDWERPVPTAHVFAGPDPWSDKYLTAEDARVLRQDGI